MKMMLISWSVISPSVVVESAALGGDHLGGDFWGEKSESVFQLVHSDQINPCALAADPL